ncbi:GlxA family transcriptional regulator [Roseateles koreensis]|uniref:GlxA family transcriptional regulator n=1 Tax=Roseateles koreensis TaxID=2987526 RepID=A0ABT5KSH6_9BURK|nr:GlxA family transcriptional regulator [Roseateles koreensis]MDC8785802.1 GlxA family transcriptional regulator [Roseateles koreensis]
MKYSTASGRQRVQIIVYPGFKGLEVVGTLSVFDYANRQLLQRGQKELYDIAIASTTVGPVQSETLLQLQATQAISASHLPETAIIVGCRNIEQAMQESPAIIDWARNAAPQIERLVALCTGSFFLAAAGLLDGHVATTHWSAAQLLKSRFPAVDVQADAIYLRNGHIWTSAGVTAGIDLALALVEEDLGREVALNIARELVVYLKRPGGQSQFSVHLEGQRSQHPSVRELQDWVLQHLHQPLSMSELASRAAMSERNFRRVFHREIGSSPMQFIETARLEAARRLLEEGPLPLKSVAGRVGFSSEQSLRKLFVKRLGVAPHEYRERFASARRET